MKNDNNLDELFREKLRNYERNPPAGLLEDVLVGVAGIRRKRRFFYWRISGVAAALLLAFVAGWQFNSRNIPVAGTSVFVKQEPVSEKASQSTSHSDLKLAAARPDLFSAKPDDENSDDQESFYKSSSISGVPAAKNKVTAPSGKTSASTDDLSLIKPLKSLYRLLAQTEIENELRERRAAEAHKDKLVKTIDQQIMEQNQQKFLSETGLRQKGKWLVGAQISPAFSIDRSSHSPVYASNMINSSNTNPVDLGGGLSVEYKTGRRLSVESGLYYSGIGQSSGSSVGSSDKGFAFADKGSNYFNTPVDIEADKVTMNSPAGVIAFSKVPSSIVLGTSIEDKALVANAVMVSDTRFIQNFNYLEIPLYLRYALIDSRFDVEMLGGFSSNLLIGNGTYLEDGTGRSLIGTTQDMRFFNYSGTLGVGLRYSISKHFFLNVEPRVKYFLNSLNNNSSVNYKPYVFGIYTGISYEF